MRTSSGLFLALCITLLAIFTSSASATWYNCEVSATLTSSMFKEFTVFPNPANVGDTIYLRAVIQPDKVIHGGTVLFRMRLNESDSSESILNIPGIPLCNISSNIQCPINTTQNIYSWQFTVPEIPEGLYVMRYDIKPDTNALAGCLQFDLQINGNVTTKNQTAYLSWYEAILGGTANFEHSNVDDRSIGEIVQVGPTGLLPRSASSGFSYGFFSSVKGSGDLVPKGGLATDGFIWGMSGNMTQKSVHNASVEHQFEGEFYVGYASLFTSFTDSLFSGTFTLSWTWNADRTQASINGYFNVSQDATLPSGWPNPILFGNLDHQVLTNSTGSLKVRGQKIWCIKNSAMGCSLDAPVTTAAAATTGKGSFSNTELGVTIGVILGFAFLVVLLVAFLTWRKNKRETEEEDGVFAVARKPEYGSALILDDIIQETQGKNRDLRPMLDPRRRMEADDSLSEDDDLGYAAPDSSSRSTSPSYSRSASRRSINGLHDDEDESRSRSPLSRSPSGKRRPRSPLSRSRSVGTNVDTSRSPSRASSRPPKYSDSEGESEEDPGSSASRRSDSDGSDDE